MDTRSSSPFKISFAYFLNLLDDIFRFKISLATVFPTNISEFGLGLIPLAVLLIALFIFTSYLLIKWKANLEIKSFPCKIPKSHSFKNCSFLSFPKKSFSNRFSKILSVNEMKPELFLM